MPGRNPKEAVEAFLDPLQDSISCIAHAKFTFSEGSRKDIGRIHSLVLNRDDAVKLKGARLLLRVQMQYEIVPVAEPGREPWRVTTRAYNYEVQTSSGEAVVSYHWHPDSKIKGPHTHLGHTQLANDAVLHGKLHLPSARLSLESVIRHCIEELGAGALRDDWDEVLARRQADFETYRKWDRTPPEQDAPDPNPEKRRKPSGKRRTFDS